MKLQQFSREVSMVINGGIVYGTHHRRLCCFVILLIVLSTPSRRTVVDFPETIITAHVLWVSGKETRSALLFSEYAGFDQIPHSPTVT